MIKTGSIVVQKFGGTSVADAALMRACTKHVKAAIDRGDRVIVVVSAMGHSTDELIELASTTGASPDPRELDQLLSTGEQAAAALFAMVLASQGVASRSLTGWQAGMLTDNRFGRASISSIDPQPLALLLEQGITPVVTGFQGMTAEGQITTLGRGGSDTSAVALAARLGGRCEIYKDVEGVFTADPRIVPDARMLDSVSYDEMLESAAMGSQVIHPRAVELARAFNVPVRVLHSQMDSRVSPGTNLVSETGAETDRVVSNVVLKRNVSRVSIRGLVNRPGIQNQVFTPIAKARVSVDDIIQEDDGPGTINLTFTLDKADLASVSAVVHQIAGEVGAAAVRMDAGLCTVSAVGAGMRNSSGVAARMFAALADESIKVENITTSEIRISVIVAEADGERATRCIHAAFQLGLTASAANSMGEIKPSSPLPAIR